MARGCPRALEMALIDPVRHRRGRHLTHPRNPLRAPIALRPSSHGIPNTTNNGSPLDPPAGGRSLSEDLQLGVFLIRRPASMTYRRGALQPIGASHTPSPPPGPAPSRVLQLPGCDLRPPTPQPCR